MENNFKPLQETLQINYLLYNFQNDEYLTTEIMLIFTEVQNY